MSKLAQQLPSPESVPEGISSPSGAYAERVPLLAALAAQGTAVLVVLLTMMIMPGETARSISPAAWALLQGGIAAVLGFSLRMESWWIPIHALFVPGLVSALALEPPPGYALALFCLLASVYWGVSGSRVPLFLSSQAAAQTVADLLPRDRSFALLDLGCGLGGVLSHLARARPCGQYSGVEVAPVPFLLCWLRSLLIGRNCRVRWEDYRNLDLGRYDVVYAYLSPAAMAGLWEKASREMRPGTLFVSNSFEVPGVRAQMVLTTGAGGGSRLLVWRMRGKCDAV